MSACTNYHHCPNPNIIRQIKVHSQITKLSPQYPTRRNSGSATVELKIEKDLRTVTGSELTRIESKKWGPGKWPHTTAHPIIDYSLGCCHGNRTFPRKTFPQQGQDDDSSKALQHSFLNFYRNFCSDLKSDRHRFNFLQALLELGH